MKRSSVPGPDAVAGKRILVTGGTGFIGGHLARRLASHGAKVIALEHTPGKGDLLRSEGIQVIPGDIADTSQMRQIISQDVQVVMHIAAWLRGRPFANYHRFNLDATRSLAEASADAGVERFVFTSSIGVYGCHGDSNVEEDTPLAPYGDPYGDSKIAGEMLLHEVEQRRHLPLVIVRPGMVYGPGSKGWTVRMVRLAQRGQIPIIDGGRGTAYPIYIENLVDLLVQCATHPGAVGQTFNGVDDGPVTLNEFLGPYLRMANTKRVVRAPGWAVSAVASIADPFFPGWSIRFLAGQLRGRGMVLNQKAKEVLGWSPRVSLADGMKYSEDWLRSEHLL